MAVKTVRQKTGGREYVEAKGDAIANGPLGDVFGREKRTAVEIYEVEMTDVLDPPTLARQAIRYKRGDSWPHDPALKCKQVTVRESQQFATLYEVRVEFERPTDTGTIDPVLEPVSFKFNYRTERLPVYKDGDGKLIVNSAGQFFDPPFEDNVSTLIMTATWNERTANMYILSHYADAVNQDKFRVKRRNTRITVPPEAAKILGIEVNPMAPGNVFPYDQITLSVGILLDGSTWVRQQADEGLYEKNDAGELVRIKDADENTVVVPHALDGAGKKLGPGLPPVFIDVLPKLRKFRLLKPFARR